MTKQTLGNEISKPDPDSVLFSDASLTVGTVVEAGVRGLTSLLPAGGDWLAVADDVFGDGSQEVSPPSTVFSKNAGAPYELMFDFTSTRKHLPRQLDVGFELSEPTTSDTLPLIAFTFLNNQTSVVVERVGASTAVIAIYALDRKLSESEPFPFIATPISLSIVDNVSAGFFAVSLNGEVVVGAAYREGLDGLSRGEDGVGVHSLAIVIGHPQAPGQEFSVEFTENLSVRSYLTEGWVGRDSRDLLDFDRSKATGLVLPSGTVIDDSLKFSASAVYIERADTLQVMVTIPAAGRGFTRGVVQLLAPDGNPMDEAHFTPVHLINGVGEGEESDVIALFGHPLQVGGGVLVRVALYLPSPASPDTLVEYESVFSPVKKHDGRLQHILTRQPDHDYPKHKNINLADVFGPASVLDTQER